MFDIEFDEKLIPLAGFNTIYWWCSSGLLFWGHPVVAAFDSILLRSMFRILSHAKLLNFFLKHLVRFK